MTEVEYVLENFDFYFAPIKTKHILLHGSRDYAKAILQRFGSEYNFVGITSRDEIDSNEFCGFPVFREEEIPQLEIDIIILTERVKYAEAVYREIHRDCRKNGIQLYNMYGLNEIETHKDILKCTPLNCSGWEELCEEYQVVAFEAMETLLKTPDLTVREPFNRLIPWLKEQGKEVFISLRKSFPADRQIDALKATGLFEKLESSLIYRTGEDLSFRTFAEANIGKRILYIGNGIVNENILPRCYGINTYRYTDSFSLFGMPVPENEPARISYNENKREELLQAIRESEVVSFDVFDTLLIRKTLQPEDVFELTELKAKAAGYPVDSFAIMRKTAERYFDCGSIYDIYDLIGDSFSWSEELTYKILELELEIENDVITPRTEMVALMDYASSCGKTVVLTSDMYLNEPIMRKLLEKKGIRSFDKLLVSCDCHRSKGNGLFAELCGLTEVPELILHIGDDLENDILAASLCGIRTEYIPSVLTLAAERGWAKSIRTAETLMERCLLGMSIAELFRDPFKNPNLFELTREERVRRFATGVVGPLVTGYMTWLIEKLREDEYDGILFLARDGYLPLHVYRELNADLTLPTAIYYYANRHSTFICCADDPDRIKDILDRGNGFDLSAAELLKKVYNLSEDEILPYIPGEKDKEYILRHMSLIEERALQARKAYREYSESCGINENGTYAVVDFFSVGSTQRNMERFLPFRMVGYYFGNYSTDSVVGSDIQYYLSVENKTIIRNFIELESFFISPEPSVDYVAEDGVVVFENEPRTAEEINECNLVFSIALGYANEFFRLFYQEGKIIRPDLPEEMFAAEGYHGVQTTAYDDFCKAKHKMQMWQDGA